MSTDTRTGRDIETLRQRLDDAKQECERCRVDGPEEVFLQAYVTVKAIELQLDEKLRQPMR